MTPDLIPPSVRPAMTIDRIMSRMQKLAQHYPPELQAVFVNDAGALVRDAVELCGQSALEQIEHWGKREREAAA